MARRPHDPVLVATNLLARGSVEAGCRTDTRLEPKLRLVVSHSNLVQVALVVVEKCRTPKFAAKECKISE